MADTVGVCEYFERSGVLESKLKEIEELCFAISSGDKEVAAVIFAAVKREFIDRLGRIYAEEFSDEQILKLVTQRLTPKAEHWATGYIQVLKEFGPSLFKALHELAEKGSEH